MAKELKRRNTELNDLSKKLNIANLELEIQATIDPLTGLLNRRGLQQVIDREINFNKRLDSKPAIVFLDIDNFKFINDNFGYSAGDAALVEIAEHIKKEFRSTDFISRVGGDEFVVVMINAGEEDVKTIVEKVRLTISRESILLLSGEKYNITASFGVFDLDKKNIQIDDSLIKAYEHMKKSKFEGKNRITYSAKFV